jgi:hypothetical protein
MDFFTSAYAETSFKKVNNLAQKLKVPRILSINKLRTVVT